MKIKLIPIKVYETGDTVLTDIGMATVIHDEMEGFIAEPTEGCVDSIKYRNAVLVRLHEETCNHTIGDEIPMDRERLIIRKGLRL